jgi:hypothetical protein
VYQAYLGSKVAPPWHIVAKSVICMAIGAKVVVHLKMDYTLKCSPSGTKAFAGIVADQVRNSIKLPQVLVVLATLVAALARIPAISTLPPQVWFDEIWFAQTAREWLQGAPLQAYYKTYWGGVHPLMIALTGVVQLLGFDSPIASRLISVPAGILNIPLAYAAIAKLLKGGVLHARRHWIGAFTAAILAALPTWIVVARIGLEWPIAATFALVITWACERARCAQGGVGWGYWALCGLTLGLGQYLSQHMRFAAPLLVLFVIHDLLGNKANRQRVLRGALFAALCSLLVALPLLGRFYEEPSLLTARAAIITNTHGLSRFEFVRWNVWLVLQGFFVAGSSSPLENVPGRALFNPLEAAAFAVGLMLVLRAIFQHAYARKLLMWLSVLSLPTLLTEGAPSFERMTHAIPAAAAIAAIGMDAVLRLIKSFRIGITWLRFIPVLGAILLLVNGLFNTGVYYADYPKAQALDDAFTAKITRLAIDAKSRAQDQPVFVEHIQESENMVHFDYLLVDTKVRYLDFRQCMPLVESVPAEAIYIVNSQRDQTTVDLLKSRYPAAVAQEQASESSWLIDTITRITIPVNSPVELTPGPSAKFDFASLRALEINTATLPAGDSLFLTLHWRTHAAIRDDLTAFVHIAADEKSPPVAQRDGAPCQGFYPTSLWRPSDVTPDAFAITIPPETPPGNYNVYVGWYHPTTLARAVLLSADVDAGDNRAQIATITITAR